MSRTSMTNEMYQLVRAFNWTLADLQRVTVNAMKSAFIPFEERLKIIEGVVKPGFARVAS
jgi:adenosine deaminase